MPRQRSESDMPKVRGRVVQGIQGKLLETGESAIHMVIFSKAEWPDSEGRIGWLKARGFRTSPAEEAAGEIFYTQRAEEEFDYDSLGGNRVTLSKDEPIGEPKSEEDDKEGQRRVIFRMSPALHERLKQFADDEDLSTNQAACRALEKFLSAQGSSSTGNPSSREGQIAELRDLREIRALLDPKKDKDAIEKVDTAIRELARKLAGIEDVKPSEKKPSEKKAKWFDPSNPWHKKYEDSD